MTFEIRSRRSNKPIKVIDQNEFRFCWYGEKPTRFTVEEALAFFDRHPGHADFHDLMTAEVEE